MAKFYFKYGVMNSSKTANLLTVAYNYEEQGRRILCLKSSLDTRWADGTTSKVGKIASRAMPTTHSCELVQPNENLFQLIKQYNAESIMKFSSSLAAVLVDEAQFLSKKQVKQLADVVEQLNIDVLCFGLKNTYIDGEIFEGTAALFYYASSIEEIKTICKYCQRKATMNLRIIDGKAVYSGNSVAIGDVNAGKETYAQVCYHHYCFPPAPIEGMYSKRNRTTMNKDFNETFNHILQYKNDEGFYCKVRSISKDKYTFSTIFTPKTSKDFQKLGYISFGPIAYNIQEVIKTIDGKKVNSVVITNAIITFLYNFFENDKNMAFNILKSSSENGIEFYENEQEYNESLINRKHSMNRYKTLPDGRKYFYDYSHRSWPFWEKVMTGISSYLGSEEVGFYITNDNNDNNEVEI